MDPRYPKVRRLPGDPPAPKGPPRAQAPALDLAVVEWLERMVPEISPLPGMRSEDLWFTHGARHTVRRVRDEYERQQKKDPL